MLVLKGLFQLSFTPGFVLELISEFFPCSDCIYYVNMYVISLHWNPMRTNERGKDHLMTAVISVDFSRGGNIDF